MTELYTLLPALFLGIGWTWGVNCLMSEGYILAPVGLVLERVLGTWFCKPLFLCPPCQASVHGPAIFILFVDLDWYYLFPYVIALTGLNYIIKEHLYPTE